MLSALDDHPFLPKAWNHEFWTKPMSEEEVGLPLVPLGEPCPIVTPKGTPQRSSPLSSRVSSRPLSRRSSSSRRQQSVNDRPSRSVSRHGSFRGRQSRPGSQRKRRRRRPTTGELEPEDVYDGDKENEEPKPIVDAASVPAATEEKLEQVKDIIEEPEDQWRILWQQPREGEHPVPDTPESSVISGSAVSSLSDHGSFLSSKLSCAIQSQRGCNPVQPGLDDDDPLSVLKISSARQWLDISQKVIVDVGGVASKETPADFSPTTAQQLRRICWQVKPTLQKGGGGKKLFSSLFAAGWGVDCDEVSQRYSTANLSSPFEGLPKFIHRRRRGGEKLAFPQPPEDHARFEYGRRPLDGLELRRLDGRSLQRQRNPILRTTSMGQHQSASHALFRPRQSVRGGGIAERRQVHGALPDGRLQILRHGHGLHDDQPGLGSRGGVEGVSIEARRQTERSLLGAAGRLGH